MSKNDESYIRLNLRIISKIKQCDRISSTHEYLHIEKKNMLLPIIRFLRGENRLKNISRVGNIFSSAKNMILNKIKLNNTQDSKIFIQELIDARDGLERLKTSTYETDQLAVASIDLISTNIETFCKKIKENILCKENASKQKKTM